MNDEFEGHTPGPWLIGRGADGWPIVHTAPDSFSPSGQGVAHVCKRPMCQDHEANARLIAAAPELLDERDRLRAEAEALADVIDTLRADAERWRFVRRKVCFSGIGDGTAHMDIINLPISAKFPDLGEHEACADAAIDAAGARAEKAEAERDELRRVTEDLNDPAVNNTVTLEDAVRDLKVKAAVAEDALLRHGYRKSCGIPACNCGDQWNHGGHAVDRLREISEALHIASPIDMQGKTLLSGVVEAVERLIAAEAERDEALTERDSLTALLPGQHYMDPPDGGDVPVVEQFRRMTKDAERYRLARSKVAIIGNGRGAEFHIINLSPTYVAPNAGAEFDAAIDAARAALKEAEPCA